jgi:hypothetical protein
MLLPLQLRLAFGQLRFVLSLPTVLFEPLMMLVRMLLPLLELLP